MKQLCEECVQREAQSSAVNGRNLCNYCSKRNSEEDIKVDIGSKSKDPIMRIFQQITEASKEMTLNTKVRLKAYTKEEIAKGILFDINADIVQIDDKYVYVKEIQKRA